LRLSDLRFARNKAKAVETDPEFSTFKGERTMSIIKIKDAAKIPSEQLEDWGTPKTIGEAICQF
jgi:hypothetical protein